MKNQYRQRLVILSSTYKQEILAIVQTFTSKIKIIGSVIYLSLDALSLLRLEYNALANYSDYFRLIPV